MTTVFFFLSNLCQSHLGVLYRRSCLHSIANGFVRKIVTRFPPFADDPIIAHPSASYSYGERTLGELNFASIWCATHATRYYWQSRGMFRMCIPSRPDALIHGRLHCAAFRDRTHVHDDRKIGVQRNLPRVRIRRKPLRLYQFLFTFLHARMAFGRHIVRVCLPVFR